MSPVRASESRRRGAILSMELVLVLPIILLLVFSIVEFSMLMSAKTRVSNATQAGARQMSLCTLSDEEIQEEIRNHLGPALARDCEIEVHPAPGPGDVGRVTVRVPMKNACPDLLWVTGFSVKDRLIVADVPMVMERTALTDPPARF